MYDEGTKWEYLSEVTDYYINQDLALSSLVDQGVEDYELDNVFTSSKEQEATDDRKAI
ncbi:hypothetical protein LJC54_05475 [Parabacteroides sp. OttesenSCG-928-J18]|nr:hypothetical protein [Parabacteroides sp. OttesenSCG-928-J18]